MATIIGGIGTSHVPTIGVTYDKGRQNEPAWAPLFDGYKPVARERKQRHAPVAFGRACRARRDRVDAGVQEGEPLDAFWCEPHHLECHAAAH